MDVSYRFIPDQHDKSLALYTHGTWNLTLEFTDGSWKVRKKASFVTEEGEEKAIKVAQDMYPNGLVYII